MLREMASYCLSRPVQKSRRIGCLACVVFVVFASPAPTQVRVTQLEQRYYLVSDPAANLLVFIDEDASLVAGVQSPSLVSAARDLLRTHAAPPVRYAIVMDGDSALAYGDGGWGRAGATTIAEEMLCIRMKQAAQVQVIRASKQDQATSGTVAPPVDVPRIGFSRVVQVYLKNEESHVVHDRPGSTDADAIVHFEKAGLLFLGNTFTTDGYPRIELERGGSLAGMIRTVEFFINAYGNHLEKVDPIVPGRGPVAKMVDLVAYRDMLVAVRDRVQALQQEGRTLAETRAARPTAEFDARWGKGRVSPDEFVRMVYQSLAEG